VPYLTAPKSSTEESSTSITSALVVALIGAETRISAPGLVIRYIVTIAKKSDSKIVDNLGNEIFIDYF
jgi:hypothetical protein